MGKSNHCGEELVDAPLAPEDLLATIYHVLGINHHATFLDRLNRPVAILPRGANPGAAGVKCPDGLQ